MEWQEINNGFAMATVGSGDSVEDAMMQLCERVARDVIPMNRDVDWDYLRVEFWADSGRIIVFPASTSMADRIEKAGCQLVFEDLLSRYEELADSDISDDEFTERLLAEEKTWIERLLTAARRSRLQGLRVIFWDAEDEQAVQDVVIERASSGSERR
jgi:hypothetical protein